MGGDGAGVDGKAVVVDPFRGDSQRPGLLHQPVRERGVDGEVEGQLAVLVPVLVHVDAAAAFTHLPELVEDRHPPGGVDEQGIGAGTIEGRPGQLEAGGDRLPGRIVRLQAGQRAAGDEKRRHHAGRSGGRWRPVGGAARGGRTGAGRRDRAGGRLPPGRSPACEDRERRPCPSPPFVPRPRPQIGDDPHQAARQEQDDEDREDPQRQLSAAQVAGHDAVDDHEDHRARDRAGEAAHAAGDDDEHHEGGPADVEGVRRRDGDVVDVEQAAGQPGHRRGDEEDQRLGPADVDPDGHRRLLVVAHRGQRQPVLAAQQAPYRDRGRRQDQQARVVAPGQRRIGGDVQPPARADHLPSAEDRGDGRGDQPGRHREIGALQAQERQRPEEDQQQDADPADVVPAEHVPDRIGQDEQLVGDPQRHSDRDGGPDPAPGEPVGDRHGEQPREQRRDGAGEGQRQPDVGAAVEVQDPHREAAESHVDLQPEREQPAVSGQQVPGMAQGGEDEHGHQEQGVEAAGFPGDPGEREQDGEQDGEQAPALRTGQPVVQEGADHREKRPCGLNASTNRMSM